MPKLRYKNSGLWVDTARRAWERDEGTCQLCLVPWNGKKRSQAIHHITPVALAPHLMYESTNLITLCSKCHGFVHSKRNVDKLFLASSIPNFEDVNI